MADQRKHSTARTIGLVPCPACRGVGGDCAVCSGGKRVTVDVAVSWTIEHGAEPSQLVGGQDHGEADISLLSAVASVLTKLAGDDSERARAISDRALTLKDIILDWRESEPSADERNDITSKVIGLHVALRALNS